MRRIKKQPEECGFSGTETLPGTGQVVCQTARKEPSGRIAVIIMVIQECPEVQRWGGADRPERGEAHQDRSSCSRTRGPDRSSGGVIALNLAPGRLQRPGPGPSFSSALPIGRTPPESELHLLSPFRWVWGCHEVRSPCSSPKAQGDARDPSKQRVYGLVDDPVRPGGYAIAVPWLAPGSLPYLHQQKPWRWGGLARVVPPTGSPPPCCQMVVLVDGRGDPGPQGRGIGGWDGSIEGLSGR
jgi:hypothetical protein